MLNLLKKRENDVQRTADPMLAPISQLRWGMDRLFEGFLDEFGTRTGLFAPGVPVDLVETDEEIQIHAEVPGIEPERMDVRLTGDVLTISGEKSEERSEQEKGRWYSERHFGAFQRSIHLPCPVDAEHVDATFKNGVLTVTLRKTESAKSRHIPVRS